MEPNIRKLSDDELVAILDKRIELESLNEAEIIDFIREVLSRRLFLKFGASSMFEFLTSAHYHYAPAVAQRKLDAARMMELFPELKESIASQELNLTQIGMLAAALRQRPVPPKVQWTILESLRGQTVRNTQIIINEALDLEVKERSKVRVQRDGSVRVEMTFSKEDWEAIENVKVLISHSVPTGELSEVLTYCARFTLAKKDPATSVREVKPRQSLGLAVSRAARRFVFRRDRSCRHRHADGRLCESRYQLQVDHIISRWAGGGNGIGNLQLLCGVHNRDKYEREAG